MKAEGDAKGIEELQDQVDLLEMKLKKSLEARKIAEDLRESQGIAFTKAHGDLVESRDLLRRQSREARSIFKNITQGILLVSADLKISDQRSDFLERILEHEVALDGQEDVVEIVFQNSDLPKDRISQINSVLKVSLGQPDFVFIMNRHHLPREFQLQLKSGEKHVEIDFNPIVDEEEMVVQFIIVLRDVTEFRKLQEATRMRDAELRMITELVAHDSDRVAAFLEDSNQSNLRSLEIIKIGKQEKTTVEELFRQAHTLKGNARTFGFTALIDQVHNIEELYQKARADLSAWDSQLMLKAASDLSDMIKKYQDVLNQRIRSHQKTGFPAYLEKILVALDQLEQNPPHNSEASLAQILALYKERHALKLRDLLSQVLVSLPGLAKELEKPEPKVEVQDSSIGFALQIRSMLCDAFTHCLRNSLDHGVEPPSERNAAGKPSRGEISIRVSPNHAFVDLLLEDDGRGLDLAGLSKKALSTGLKPSDLKTEDQIAETIFRSGVSTAREITSVSGRGVGMDAVRAALKGYGCTIRIEFSGDKNAQGYRPFRLVMSIPRKYTLQLT